MAVVRMQDPLPGRTAAQQALEQGLVQLELGGGRLGEHRGGQLQRVARHDHALGAAHLPPHRWRVGYAAREEVQL